MHDLKWIVFIFLLGCASKYENRWCYQPEGKYERCYQSEPNCLEARAKKPGSFCTASEKL